ncbi:unnamed protein product [Vitrella brassicaformis CCMP3155]|uniref:Uncharacterized protein n=4 Tax=Vitrella brassicaformis TaxID=1169539 RepID=A0A0G4EYV0_VITBC|nr:unnamed protein product [Vitrella brassicaformis CCMP3155]|eukprot:CEM04248.1 unnamed protein product [Vitrella brassicaformis CCMP3155]
MLKRLLVRLLNRAFGAVFENFQGDQFTLSLFRGHVTFKNLTFKQDLFRMMSLPVDVTYGKVGNLTIKIPWMALTTQPIIVEAENLILIATTKPSAAWDIEAEKQVWEDFKRLILDQDELFTFLTGRQKEETLFHQLGYLMLRNLRLTIHNFEMRLEDSEIRPDRPFAFGWAAKSISTVEADVAWRPLGRAKEAIYKTPWTAFTTERDDISKGRSKFTKAFFKRLVLEECSLYLDDLDSAVDEGGASDGKASRFWLPHPYEQRLKMGSDAMKAVPLETMCQRAADAHQAHTYLHPPRDLELRLRICLVPLFPSDFPPDAREAQDPSFPRPTLAPQQVSPTTDHDDASSDNDAGAQSDTKTDAISAKAEEEEGSSSGHGLRRVEEMALPMFSITVVGSDASIEMTQKQLTHSMKWLEYNVVLYRELVFGLLGDIVVRDTPQDEIDGYRAAWRRKLTGEATPGDFDTIEGFEQVGWVFEILRHRREVLMALKTKVKSTQQPTERTRLVPSSAVESTSKQQQQSPWSPFAAVTGLFGARKVVKDESKEEDERKTPKLTHRVRMQLQSSTSQLMLGEDEGERARGSETAQRVLAETAEEVEELLRKEGWTEQLSPSVIESLGEARIESDLQFAVHLTRWENRLVEKSASERNLSLYCEDFYFAFRHYQDMGGALMLSMKNFCLDDKLNEWLAIPRVLQGRPATPMRAVSEHPSSAPSEAVVSDNEAPSKDEMNEAGGFWMRFEVRLQRKLDQPDIVLYGATTGELSGAVSPVALFRTLRVFTRDLQPADKAYLMNKASDKVRELLERSEGFITKFLVGDFEHFSGDVCIDATSPLRILVPFDAADPLSRGLIFDAGRVQVDSIVRLPRQTVFDPATPLPMLYDRYLWSCRQLSLYRVPTVAHLVDSEKGQELQLSHFVRHVATQQHKTDGEENGRLGWLVIAPVSMRFCADVCHFVNHEKLPSLRLLAQDATPGGLEVNVSDCDLLGLLRLTHACMQEVEELARIIPSETSKETLPHLDVSQAIDRFLESRDLTRDTSAPLLAVHTERSAAIPATRPILARSSTAPDATALEGGASDKQRVSLPTSQPLVIENMRNRRSTMHVPDGPDLAQLLVHHNTQLPRRRLDRTVKESMQRTALTVRQRLVTALHDSEEVSPTVGSTNRPRFTRRGSTISDLTITSRISFRRGSTGVLTVSDVGGDLQPRLHSVREDHLGAKEAEGGELQQEVEPSPSERPKTAEKKEAGLLTVHVISELPKVRLKLWSARHQDDGLHEEAESKRRHSSPSCRPLLALGIDQHHAAVDSTRQGTLKVSVSLLAVRIWDPSGLPHGSPLDTLYVSSRTFQSKAVTTAASGSLPGTRRSPRRPGGKRRRRSQSPEPLQAETPPRPAVPKRDGRVQYIGMAGDTLTILPFPPALTWPSLTTPTVGFKDKKKADGATPHIRLMYEGRLLDLHNALTVTVEQPRMTANWDHLAKIIDWSSIFLARVPGPLVLMGHKAVTASPSQSPLPRHHPPPSPPPPRLLHHASLSSITSGSDVDSHGVSSTTVVCLRFIQAEMWAPCYQTVALAADASPSRMSATLLSSPVQSRDSDRSNKPGHLQLPHVLAFRADLHLTLRQEATCVVPAPPVLLADGMPCYSFDTSLALGTSHARSLSFSAETEQTMRPSLLAFGMTKEVESLYREALKGLHTPAAARWSMQGRQEAADVGKQSWEGFEAKPKTQSSGFHQVGPEVHHKTSLRFSVTALTAAFARPQLVPLRVALQGQATSSRRPPTPKPKPSPASDSSMKRQKKLRHNRLISPMSEISGPSTPSSADQEEEDLVWGTIDWWDVMQGTPLLSPCRVSGKATSVQREIADQKDMVPAGLTGEIAVEPIQLLVATDALAFSYPLLCLTEAFCAFTASRVSAILMTIDRAKRQPVNITPESISPTIAKHQSILSILSPKTGSDVSATSPAARSPSLCNQRRSSLLKNRASMESVTFLEPPAVQQEPARPAEVSPAESERTKSSVGTSVVLSPGPIDVDSRRESDALSRSNLTAGGDTAAWSSQTGRSWGMRLDLDEVKDVGGRLWKWLASPDYPITADVRIHSVSVQLVENVSARKLCLLAGHVEDIHFTLSRYLSFEAHAFLLQTVSCVRPPTATPPSPSPLSLATKPALSTYTDKTIPSATIGPKETSRATSPTSFFARAGLLFKTSAAAAVNDQEGMDARGLETGMTAEDEAAAEEPRNQTADFLETAPPFVSLAFGFLVSIDFFNRQLGECESLVEPWACTMRALQESCPPPPPASAADGPTAMPEVPVIPSLCADATWLNINFAPAVLDAGTHYLDATSEATLSFLCDLRKNLSSSVRAPEAVADRPPSDSPPSSPSAAVQPPARDKDADGVLLEPPTPVPTVSDRSAGAVQDSGVSAPTISRRQIGRALARGIQASRANVPPSPPAARAAADPPTKGHLKEGGLMVLKGAAAFAGAAGIAATGGLDALGGFKMLVEGRGRGDARDEGGSEESPPWALPQPSPLLNARNPHDDNREEGFSLERILMTSLDATLGGILGHRDDKQEGQDTVDRRSSVGQIAARGSVGSRPSTVAAHLPIAGLPFHKLLQPYGGGAERHSHIRPTIWNLTGQPIGVRITLKSAARSHPTRSVETGDTAAGASTASYLDRLDGFTVERKRSNVIVWNEWRKVEAGGRLVLPRDDDESLTLPIVVRVRLVDTLYELSNFTLNSAHLEVRPLPLAARRAKRSVTLTMKDGTKKSAASTRVNLLCRTTLAGSNAFHLHLSSLVVLRNSSSRHLKVLPHPDVASYSPVAPPMPAAGRPSVPPSPAHSTSILISHFQGSTVLSDRRPHHGASQIDADQEEDNIMWQPITRTNVRLGTVLPPINPQQTAQPSVTTPKTEAPAKAKGKGRGLTLDVSSPSASVDDGIPAFEADRAISIERVTSAGTADIMSPGRTFIPSSRRSSLVLDLPGDEELVWLPLHWLVPIPILNKQRVTRDGVLGARRSLGSPKGDGDLKESETEGKRERKAHDIESVWAIAAAADQDTKHFHEVESFRQFFAFAMVQGKEVLPREVLRKMADYKGPSPRDFGFKARLLDLPFVDISLLDQDITRGRRRQTHTSARLKGRVQFRHRASLIEPQASVDDDAAPAFIQPPSRRSKAGLMQLACSVSARSPSFGQVPLFFEIHIAPALKLCNRLPQSLEVCLPSGEQHAIDAGDDFYVEAAPPLISFITGKYRSSNVQLEYKSSHAAGPSISKRRPRDIADAERSRTEPLVFRHAKDDGDTVEMACEIAPAIAESKFDGKDGKGGKGGGVEYGAHSGDLSAYSVFHWDTCQRSIKVFSPHWIVNRQSVDVRVGTKKKSQRIPSKTRRILCATIGPKVRVGLTIEADMSQGFSIDAVGASGQLVIPRTKDQIAIWLGMRVKLAPPPFFRTKVVDLFARFTLVNEMSESLWFKEAGSGKPVRLTAHQMMVLHPQQPISRAGPQLLISLVDPENPIASPWTPRGMNLRKGSTHRMRSPSLIMLMMAEKGQKGLKEETFYSSEFPISERASFQVRHMMKANQPAGRKKKGSVLVRLPEGEVMTQLYTITQVEVQVLESAAIFVRFSKPRIPEFKLFNNSPYKIQFAHMGARVADAIELLLPDSRVDYAWHDPQSLRKLLKITVEVPTHHVGDRSFALVREMTRSRRGLAALMGDAVAQAGERRRASAEVRPETYPTTLAISKINTITKLAIGQDKLYIMTYVREGTRIVEFTDSSRYHQRSHLVRQSATTRSLGNSRAITSINDAVGDSPSQKTATPGGRSLATGGVDLPPLLSARQVEPNPAFAFVARYWYGHLHTLEGDEDDENDEEEYFSDAWDDLEEDQSLVDLEKGAEDASTQWGETAIVSPRSGEVASRSSSRSQAPLPPAPSQKKMSSESRRPSRRGLSGNLSDTSRGPSHRRDTARARKRSIKRSYTTRDGSKSPSRLSRLMAGRLRSPSRRDDTRETEADLLSRGSRNLLARPSTEGETDMETEQSQRPTVWDSFEIECRLRGIGISLNEESPRELAYAAATGVELYVVRKGKRDGTAWRASVDSIQIDNRVRNAYFPSFLRPYMEQTVSSSLFWGGQAPTAPLRQTSMGSNREGSFLAKREAEDGADGGPLLSMEWGVSAESRSMFLSKGKDHNSALILRYANCSLKPLAINVEQDAVLGLLSFFLGLTKKFNIPYVRTQTILRVRQSQIDGDSSKGPPRSEAFRQLIEAPSPPTSSPLSRYLYIQTLFIDPILVVLSIRNSRVSTVDSGRDWQFIRYFELMSGRLTDLSQSPLYFREVQKEQVYVTTSDLIQDLSSTYGTQGWRQFTRVLGSIDLIGNPLGLMIRILQGLFDLVKEPYEGILKGPEQFIGGLGRGLKALIVAIIAGLFDSFSRITRSLYKVLDRAVNMDKTLSVVPRRFRISQVAIEQPENVADGVLRAVQGLLQCLVAAFLSLVVIPYKRVVRPQGGSVVHLPMGVVKGFGRFCVAILGGILLFLQGVSAGVRNSLSNTKDASGYSRPVRTYGTGRRLGQYGLYEGQAVDSLASALQGHITVSILYALPLPLLPQPPVASTLPLPSAALPWYSPDQNLKGTTKGLLVITSRHFFAFQNDRFAWVCPRGDVVRIEMLAHRPRDASWRIGKRRGLSLLRDDDDSFSEGSVRGQEAPVTLRLVVHNSQEMPARLFKNIKRFFASQVEQTEIAVHKLHSRRASFFRTMTTAIKPRRRRHRSATFTNSYDDYVSFGHTDPRRSAGSSDAQQPMPQHPFFAGGRASAWTRGWSGTDIDTIGAPSPGRNFLNNYGFPAHLSDGDQSSGSDHRSESGSPTESSLVSGVAIDILPRKSKSFGGEGLLDRRGQGLLSALTKSFRTMTRVASAGTAGRDIGEVKVPSRAVIIPPKRRTKWQRSFATCIWSLNRLCRSLIRHCRNYLCCARRRRLRGRPALDTGHIDMAPQSAHTRHGRRTSRLPGGPQHPLYIDLRLTLPDAASALVLFDVLSFFVVSSRHFHRHSERGPEVSEVAGGDRRDGGQDRTNVNVGFTSASTWVAAPDGTLRDAGEERETRRGGPGERDRERDADGAEDTQSTSVKMSRTFGRSMTGNLA